MADVSKLYDLYYTISNAKGKESEHVKEYEEILGGVKGEVSARKITGQFISRYFSTFPTLEEKSLDALFDLCEDDDSTIRKQTISSLGVVCKGKPAHVPKVSDILAQLLQVDDASEINCVNASLVSLLRVHVKGALTGLFYQLESNPSDLIRERVLRFLIAKVPALGDVFTKEIQIFIFQEAKKIINKTKDADLDLLMQLLLQMSVCRTTSGKQQLHDSLVSQLDFTKPLVVKPNSIVKTISVLFHAKSFYSNQVKSTATVGFLMKQVLPKLEAIEAALLVTGKPEHASMVIRLLQLLAQILPFTESVEDPKAAMEHVHKALMTVLPVPPASGAPEAPESSDSTNLQFSRVECLLFILQQLIKHNKENFFTDADVLKDLRHRLTYFSRWSQAYQKVLRDAISAKKGDELKTEESRTKLIALKTTANINTIVKDFFHNPPAAKSTITLSWIVEPEAVTAPKRSAEAMAESPKAAKASRQIYAPPSGKFSASSGSYTGGRGGGKRGRGGRRGGRY